MIIFFMILCQFYFNNDKVLKKNIKFLVILMNVLFKYYNVILKLCLCMYIYIIGLINFILIFSLDMLIIILKILLIINLDMLIIVFEVFFF